MKVNLAYNNKLSLPNKKTFLARVKFLNKKIFNNKNYMNEKEKITYENYYNLNSLEIDDKHIRNIKRRWIGVKRVNQPYSDESLKFTFNYLTNYLLASKDYSAKKYIHRFAELQRKQFKNKKISEDEQTELQLIRNNIIYYKILPKTNMSDDIIFYDNVNYENLIKDRLKQIKIDILDYNNSHKIYDLNEMQLRLTDTLCSIQNIKNKMNNHKNEISEYRLEIKNCKLEINKLYKDLKLDKKNEYILNDIISLMDKIRKNKNSIKYLDNNIRNLVDDYMILTELQTSTI